MLVEQLRTDWRARSQRQRLHERPCFVGAGLVLGADTVLAKAGGLDAQMHPQGGEARLKALLGVAYGRPVPPESLGHVRVAAERWRAGDARMASLHLALSRLGRLNPPAEAARRLFMADGLMRAGVAPEQILAALDAALSAGEAARKYSPDQPRVPAGSGRTSGQWTSGAGAGAGVGIGGSATGSRPGVALAPARWPASRPAASSLPAHPILASLAATAGEIEAGALAGGGFDLAAMSAATLARLATFVTVLGEAGLLGASILAGGVAAAVGIVVASGTGPKGKWVRVGGPGDVSYFLQPDESAIRFRYTTANRVEEIFTASPDPDGNYRDPQGNPIAKWVRTAGKIALVINLAAFAGADKSSPNLCPDARQDRPGARPKDQDFEDFMKAQVNPDNPTPRGMAYQFYNPATGKFVTIDDCQHETGFIFEYKGTTYSRLLSDKTIGPIVMQGMVDQALDQVAASQGRQLVWVFAEKSAADAVRARFKVDGEGLDKIMVLDVSQYEQIQ